LNPGHVGGAPGRATWSAVSRSPWHILTGEYPPMPGGVSDYTHALARGLAAAGDEVHVWAPLADATPEHAPGVVAHALPRGFGPAAIRALSRGLRACGKGGRLLIQYVPTAYGFKAMNLPFVTWLALRREQELWVMFHEVAFPWGRGYRARQNVLGGVTRVMASLLARRADRTFVSIPGWNAMLRSLAPRSKAAHWLPIPSNIPESVDARAIAHARRQILAGVGEGDESSHESTKVVGHFGTYGVPHESKVAEVVGELARRERKVVIALLGRGGKAFARRHGLELGARFYVPGDLPSEDVAAHLAACDVVVQPFVDGISSRRTSAMASLALGRPVVANSGPLTEPGVWTSAVELVSGCRPPELVRAIEGLLEDEARAEALGARAERLYRERFALERTVEYLTRGWQRDPNECDHVPTHPSFGISP